MSNLIWKYTTPLPAQNELDQIETRYNFSIPADLKKCLIVNNGGMPDRIHLSLAEGGMVEFGYLLPFDAGEVEEFYDILDSFELCENGRLRLFPFARDPAGNLFCVRDDKIVFLDHETDDIFPICDTFTELLGKLVE